MVLTIPWIVLALVAYNVIVFFFGASPPADPVDAFSNELFSFPMPSGGTWVFTTGDMVLLLALAALFLEILKSTYTQAMSMIDHGLSMVLFIVCLIEFLVIPEAATSLFFAITMIALMDVVAGFYISMASARRDVSIGG